MTSPPPGQWSPPPGPPPWGSQQPGPRGGGAAKWILGGLALLVVVVLTVVATLLLTRGDSQTGTPQASSPSATTPADTSPIASAEDDGPVEVITEDPTCTAWGPIAETFSAQASKGWNDRDPSIPATGWTAAQRAQHEAIADAMASAADQTVALVKLTTHRVMRELYDQSIAYWRAYAAAVPAYTPNDDHLARVATAAANAVGNICSAITFGSAASRAPLVAPSPAPYGVGELGNPQNPARYVTEPLSVCPDWIATAEEFDNATAAWLNTDANIPASQWSPEQQAIYLDVLPIMQSNAGEMQNLGAQSLDPVFDDFAALAAQYRRAFVQSIPSYLPADGYLANTAAELSAANSHACRAVGAS